MATPVPPNKNPTPKEYLPPPPTPEMKQPADYKKTLQAHKDHRVVSKCYEFFKAYRECKKNWQEQRKRDRSS
ncbi:aerobic respiration-related protein [Trichosporon asahii var. asahii CBS 8904]|uniref:Aerobic respiration-related protein n=2 Tax=Trichosporon asahii var. asahii TaxID=189963 RepID=K1W5B8_TRIAC|nr:aerobic respiration-related protein [Trichosporon asahii var. asahii CBS 2479]EJT46279.1 aerobic respiration-related protein [Trichosporon asahii var. asahii CBS 2479]EKD04123.1 aerobic respiration-related protein [Trichosporon asahii var. asahii CBS 8904]